LQDDKSVSSRRGTAEIQDLFGKKVFSFPKPVDLMKRFIQVGSGKDDIVLDFFAGSGSFAQAVLELNTTEIERNFICVQLPEKCGADTIPFEEGYESISDVTKERIRRVINKEKAKSGFRVFRLINSNFKKWSDYKGQDVAQLTAQFEVEANSPFAPDWNKNKLFTEILLLEGFPLDVQVNELKIGDNGIKKVTSELVSNQLLICMDEKIGATLISDLKIDHNSSFICLDSAITNQDKLRLSDKGLIKTI
jgi:adenine-specific DNA-methyltransferase